MGGENGCWYVGVDVDLGWVMALQRSSRIFFMANPRMPCTTWLFGVLRIAFCLLRFSFCEKH